MEMVVALLVHLMERLQTVKVNAYLPVVSVLTVLALVVLGGAVYGYIQVISHLLKLKNPQTGTANKLLT